MKIIFRGLLFSICVLFGAMSFGANSFYEARVAVSSQEKSEFRHGIENGFLSVLVRLTGLPQEDLLNQMGVRKILKGPRIEGFLESFQYEIIEDQSFLGLKFSEQKVDAFLNEARLPVWLKNRPSMILWLAYQENALYKILSSTDDLPMVSIINQISDERGLPLHLPMMDLTDQLSISPSEVATGVLGQIQKVSSRYGVEVLVSARVDTHGNMYQAFWEMHWRGRSYTVSSEAQTQEDLLRKGLNQLINYLSLDRSLILDNENAQTVLHINNISSMSAYLEALDYLNQLDYIDEVFVYRFDGELLSLAIQTSLSSQKILDFIGLDQKLFPKQIRDRFWVFEWMRGE